MVTHVIIAFHLVTFTGPNGQAIQVNPMEVVTIRPVKKGDQHFGRGINCLIHTGDGKFVAVVEDCDTVKRMLEEEAPP